MFHIISKRIFFRNAAKSKQSAKIGVIHYFIELFHNFFSSCLLFVHFIKHNFKLLEAVGASQLKT